MAEQSVPSPQIEHKVAEKKGTVIVPVYQNMKSVVAVAKRGFNPGELFFPQAIAFDSENRIFVAEGFIHAKHSRISIFSDKGEFLDSFKHPDLIDACGIAIHEDNLYVTQNSGYAIFHFKIAKDFPLISKHDTERGSTDTFSCGIAASTNGDLYFANYCISKVEIFNSSLKHLRYLTKDPIKRPMDIKLTANEVYVLCNLNPRVHVFSHTGEKIRSLISLGDEMQMLGPFWFCLDAAENIIVSEFFEHNVKVFTKEGVLITVIGKKGDEAGMLFKPCGVALTKELGLVVVSHSDNCGFQIFSSV